MRAVVLVGGEGTRLRPLTYTAPKQMLPVVDVPMIVRVLEQLARHGVDCAVLSLGYRPDAFLEAFPSSEAAGVHLEYAVEPTPLDTAGAVRFAALHAGIDDTFVVVNGDVLTDLDVTELVRLHRERRAECTIALTPVADPSAFGIVVTDAEGRVREFVEKPPRETAAGNLANAGTYVMEPSVLARIPQGRRVSIERETFPALCADGTLYAFASDAYWLDTGTPALYLAAQLDIVAGRRDAVRLPPSVEREPGVHLGPGATVAGTVLGPTYIGAGARIDASAHVERAVVSAGVVVEAEAVVRGSVVLAGAVVGAGARVEDSVVGPQAALGAGSVVRAGTVVGAGAEVPAGAELVDARHPASAPA